VKPRKTCVFGMQTHVKTRSTPHPDLGPHRRDTRAVLHSDIVARLEKMSDIEWNAKTFGEAV